MFLFFVLLPTFFLILQSYFKAARVAELVDALDSKSSSFGVWVRFPPRVLEWKAEIYVSAFLFPVQHRHNKSFFFWVRGLLVNTLYNIPNRFMGLF